MYNAAGRGRRAISRALGGTGVGIGVGTGVTLAKGITKGSVGVGVPTGEEGKVASVGDGKPLIGEGITRVGSGSGVWLRVGDGDKEVGAPVGPGGTGVRVGILVGTV